MTRRDDPETSMPSQSVMANPASQFKETVPAHSSRIASKTSQSSTKPGLFPGSGTAVPPSQACRGGLPDARQKDDH